jgi:hypothetical protein
MHSSLIVDHLVVAADPAAAAASGLELPELVVIASIASTNCDL